jgi:putative copper resistance protein D
MWAANDWARLRTRQEQGVYDPLIFVRAVHFAATLSLAGVALFDIFIAQPTLRPPASAELRVTVGGRLAWVAWIGLLLTLMSGAAWFVLVAQSISDQPLESVVSDGDVLRAVLLDTEFGRNWLLRLLLIGLLVGLLAVGSPGKQAGRGFLELAIALVAAGLAGTLAWAGHGIGGVGGRIHLAADFVHLIAAAAWVGGLLPLALMLAAAGGSFTVAHAVSLRFSAYGIVAVGVLLLTGAINTWYLAGSIRALTETDYGNLLVVKIVLFLVMLALATVNRLWITPVLAAGAGETPARLALSQLRRNVVIEIAVGAVILAVVAVLGVTPPGVGE